MKHARLLLQFESVSHIRVAVSKVNTCLISKSKATLGNSDCVTFAEPENTRLVAHTELRGERVQLRQAVVDFNFRDSCTLYVLLNQLGYEKVLLIEYLF